MGGKKPKGKNRTWYNTNTIRKKNLSTIKGDKKATLATLRSLRSSFLTLGSGNLYEAITVPEDMIQEAFEFHVEEGMSEAEAKKEAKIESLNEWVAANTVDFFNELQLLYGLVEEYHAKTFQGKDQGFPPGLHYRFPGHEISTGSDYVNAVSSWIEDQIENPQIFPELDTDPFPPNFIDQYVRDMFKRMTRIFAIMYTRCIPSFREIDAVKHLNTCFKHFYYFVKR